MRGKILVSFLLPPIDMVIAEFIHGYTHLFVYRERIKSSIKSRRYIENSTRRIYTGRLSLYAVHATKVWALIKPTCIKRYLNVPWTDHPFWKRSAISVGRYSHLYHYSPNWEGFTNTCNKNLDSAKTIVDTRVVFRSKQHYITKYCHMYRSICHSLGKTFLHSYSQFDIFISRGNQLSVALKINWPHQNSLAVMYATRKSYRQLFTSPWTGTYEKYDTFRILDGINFEMDTHISKRVRTNRKRKI